MTLRLDDLDRRILYHLGREARGTSAPDIAAEMDVTPPTVRNRISRLEDRGVLRGYHAHIDYERVEGRLTNLFMCTTSAVERERLASQALQIPGVVNVREIMTGHQNLHVKAVGTDSDDLTRIARALTELGLEIEDEDLVQTEQFHPYHQFGPQDDEGVYTVSDHISLPGDTDVVNVTVPSHAPIVGKTLRGASEAGLLEEETLIVALEREGKMLTPKGDTRIEAGDLVTILFPDGMSEAVVAPFVERE